MIRYLLSLLFLFQIFSLKSQNVTMGLMYQNINSQPGTILFAPTNYTKTYLIDKCGYKLHSWNSNYKPGHSTYLLNDGTLLRAGNTNNNTFGLGGGGGGIIEKIDWNGNVTWSYQISNTNICQHHDIKILPNGNILALVWERKTRAQAIAAGRDSAFLNNYFWNEKIMELQPVGTNQANIVWEWNIWDHLIQNHDSTKNNYGIINQHPELLNINANFSNSSFPDWIHLNSIDYNETLDQIIVSSRILSEIWIIDHSTTTSQAASHAGGNSGKGGDLLYRWGNPKVYDRGNASNQQFFGQHNAHWIPQGLLGAGDIMVFNNGKDRPGRDYTSIDIIKPLTDSMGNYIFSSSFTYMPDSAYWIYKDSTPTNFYADKISGAQRLPNTNLLICDGPKGVFFEVDTLGNLMWKYKNPVNGLGPGTQGNTIFNNNVFRTVFYEQSYSGFTGHSLIPGPPIELNPVSYFCNVPLDIATELNTDKKCNIYPNPFTNELKIISDNVSFSKFIISIYDIRGKIILAKSLSSSVELIDTSFLNSGFYVLSVHIDGTNSNYKFIKNVF